MPTIFVEDGFAVKIWGPPREHPPPHVHVQSGQRGMIVIRLGLGEQPPVVWRHFAVNRRDVLRAYRIVERRQAELRLAWEAIHGEK